MTIDVGRVAMIPVEKIIICDRVRKEMGDLDGLEEDMKETGLITPLAVQSTSDDNFILLAGERRFIVLKRHGVEEVPVRIYDRDLTELEMKVIEKSENFHRKDMEYWELDQLTLEIQKLQQEAHGVKASGPGEGWSHANTGQMLGVSRPSVSQAIMRAEAREAFPELFADCKTAADASKIIKKLGEEAVKQQLAQKLQAEATDTDFKKISDRFVIRDFFDGVKKIPDGIIHLVEIDPPYAIELSKQKKKDGESKYILDNYNELQPDDYKQLMPRLFAECYRVMADHSWLICWFAPQPWFESMYLWIRGAGFGTTRMCGIWTKGVPGQNMNPSTRLANSYEMFFYAWKGQPALNKPGSGNEFPCPPLPAQQKVHPTERPIELMEKIYDTFAFSGSRVLIPFLGSGNGLLAAHRLGMEAVGFELSKSYKDSFLVKAHKLFEK